MALFKQFKLLNCSYRDSKEEPLPLVAIYGTIDRSKVIDAIL